MHITNALVVDDDIAVCRILHRMLSDEQYKVETSQSVADALAAVEQKPFDAAGLLPFERARVFSLDKSLPKKVQNQPGPIEIMGPVALHREPKASHSVNGNAP